jgi:hypothetical protein
MTSKKEIRDYLKRGMKQGATHVLVVCDHFDYEDYPVFVLSNENINDKIKEYHHKNMQTVMEIYNLRLPLEEQLSQKRVWNV